MTKQQSDQPALEPESALKVRPFTEDADAVDAEGHAVRPGQVTEDPAMDPESAARPGRLTEDTGNDDVEGHAARCGR